MPSLSVIKKEVALVAGVALGLIEALNGLFVTGAVHDVIAYASPVLVAFGVRANVTPVAHWLNEAFPIVDRLLAVGKVLEPAVKQLKPVVDRADQIVSRLEATVPPAAVPTATEAKPAK